MADFTAKSASEQRWGSKLQTILGHQRTYTTMIYVLLGGETSKRTTRCIHLLA